MVVFAGDWLSGEPGETWEWVGAAWSLRSTTGPLARTGAALAFDAARGVTVLYGGSTDVALGDTWEWDGNVWTFRANGPGLRLGHAMAYDPVRGRTVMFGGYVWTDRPRINGEIWEWNGATWSRRTTTGPIRAHHKMAYNDSRGKVELYGGDAGQRDTWEWNGSAWTFVDVGGPSTDGNMTQPGTQMSFSLDHLGSFGSGRQRPLAI